MNTQIWQINRDGSRLQQLTDVQEELLWPAWSPDGSAIAAVPFRATSGLAVHGIYLFTPGTDRSHFVEFDVFTYTHGPLSWN